MFCPSCGVKNEGGGLKCFVCRKTLPPLEPLAERSPARTRFVRVVSNAETMGAVGDRMIALAFDRALLAAVILALAATQERSIRDFRNHYTVGSSIGLGIAFAFLLVFAYHVVLEATAGATLGKAILGLTVRNVGERNRFVAALLRNVMRIVDAMGMYAVAFFVALFSPRKQRIGDYVAGTVVLEQRIHWAARGMFLLVWAAIIGVCVFLAASFCPACVNFPLPRV